MDFPKSVCEIASKNDTLSRSEKQKQQNYCYHDSKIPSE